MAYLHCHSCDWSQDDFWEWKWSLKFWKSRPFGYNPLSVLFDDIRYYIKPRHIEFDRCCAEEMGFKSSRIFSWVFLLYEIKRGIRRFRHMRWWTYRAWMKECDVAVCPCCGAKDFDID